MSVTILLALSLAPAHLVGQSTATGKVAGIVTDPSGASIPGATVALTDRGTGITRTVQTNLNGRYIFPSVNLGAYDLSASKEGFQQTKLVNQTVNVGATLTANIQMKVGAATQTVEVTSAPGAELQTMNATMGTSISGATALALPNLGRDASSLLQYQANTNPSGQIAGAVTDQNTYMLDGGNNTSDLDGNGAIYTGGFSSNNSGSGVVPTPVESIEEVNVATNNPTADYASASGGEIMMVTKRGTNDWHGSLYDFYQANWLNANSWDNNRNGIRLQKTHQNRFGGALGGTLLPTFWGGKTFFYANYEGRRYPEAGTRTLTVPSALMRQGILQFRDATGAIEQYNLATAANCGSAGNLPCDPRHIGLNPVVNMLWSKYMPLGNNASAAGDGLNTIGDQQQINLPIQDDSVAFRMDHNFGKNWQWMTSYRFFREIKPTTTQIDWGGEIAGDTLGVPTSRSNHPLQPRYLVTSLTGQITPNLTNQFHFNFVRNWWAWVTAGVPKLAPGVPAGVSVNGLDPMTISWGSARQRIWDGNDWNYSDDLSWIHGNHFVQVGGNFYHDWMHHTRDDNAAGSLTAQEYNLGKASSIQTSAGFRPPNCAAAKLQTGCITAKSSTWDTLYYETLGTLANANVFASRVGPNLTLQPPGTMLFDTSVIDSWSVYASDSWHLSPSLTLTYGLNWGAEMPPVEANGKQVMLVDASGNLVNAQNYLTTKERQALAGHNYNPVLGYEPVGDINGGEKYPFPPYYGGVSPRFAVAWNPNFNRAGFLRTLFGANATVVRGGWARINDRTNGVNMVLVPLLGVGFGQANFCYGANSPAATGQPLACAGQLSQTAATAFRLGTDGNVAPLAALAPTLNTPILPGVNSVPVSNGDTLAPDYRPGTSDEFTFSLQRQLPGHMLLELGWVGRWQRHQYRTLDLNNVPYMMTLGGQSFAKAYAGLANQLNANPSMDPNTVTVQPFFEAALANGPGNYCGIGAAKGGGNSFASCTAAVAAKEGPNGTGNITTQYVTDFWQDLENNWVFGPALVASQGLGGAELSGSSGYSNYNAGTLTLQKRASNGLTLDGNFTWSHALSLGEIEQAYVGSQTVNPYNPHYDYGTAPFDLRYVANLTALYELPFGSGQHGVLGRLIGGWSVAPIVSWHSGNPLQVYGNSYEEYGAPNANSDNDVSAIPTKAIPAITEHFGYQSDGVTGVNNDVSASNPHGVAISAFSSATAVYNSFRPAILGQDASAVTIFGYGQSFWNADLNLRKEIKVSEKMGATFNVEMINAFNHVNWNDPNLNLQDQASFGNITGVSPGPRTVEMGLRLHW